jgi:hypothetical protein
MIGFLGARACVMPAALSCSVYRAILIACIHSSTLSALVGKLVLIAPRSRLGLDL